MKVDVKGYQGAIEKSAVVSSNDPKNPEVKLSIQAFVKVPITLEPRGVMLGGAVGEEVKRTVVLKAYLDKPLKLEAGANSLPEKVAYEIVTVKEGRWYQIVLRNISSKEEDRYSGSITFKTNYPEQPVITIQYLGYIWKPGTEIPKSEGMEPGQPVK